MATLPLIERCDLRPVELATVRADRICLSDKLIEDDRRCTILVATLAGDLVTLAMLDRGHIVRRTFSREAKLDVARPC